MPRNLELCPDGADFHRYLQVLCSVPFSAYLPPSIQDALPSVLAYARNTAANQDKPPGQRQPYTEKATLEGAYALLQATPPLATHIAEAAADSIAGAPAGTVAAGPDPAVAAVVAAISAAAPEPGEAPRQSLLRTARELFQAFDVDKSGSLDYSEVTLAAQA